MSIKVHLYRKYLYRIKPLCCPRKSCKIIFKNTNCLFHYGNHFRMEVPNMFSQRFNLLCYIEWSQVWDFSSKYDFPLWSALEEHDRKTQSNMWIKFLFFFKSSRHFPQAQINVNQALLELWPLKLYLHRQISLTKSMFTVSFI